MQHRDKWENIFPMLEEADKILIGLGDDFEMSQYLRESAIYQNVCNDIVEAKCQWIIPYVNYSFLKNNDDLKKAYDNLKELLNNKDYFIISVCTNSMIQDIGLSNQRIVEPCGSYRKLQKRTDSGYEITPVNTGILSKIDECIARNENFCSLKNMDKFNSLYTEPYAEEGYLEQWQTYTKWLQGTLNHKLCILELGSGMMFANVLRFRFEKVVSLNQKARLIRVNKMLYQLPAEIADKGISIPYNAVEFMAEKDKI